MAELTIRFPSIKGIGESIRNVASRTVEGATRTIDNAAHGLQRRRTMREMRKAQNAMHEINRTWVQVPEAAYAHADRITREVIAAARDSGVDDRTMLMLVDCGLAATRVQNDKEGTCTDES